MSAFAWHDFGLRNKIDGLREAMNLNVVYRNFKYVNNFMNVTERDGFDLQVPEVSMWLNVDLSEVNGRCI